MTREREEELALQYVTQQMKKAEAEGRTFDLEQDLDFEEFRQIKHKESLYEIGCKG
jgi:hypothetical protein